MYTVKVLSPKDFDTLPYKHAKRSLGLADAKTGVAFVRDTGYNDITKATISHELDELVNKVSPHEEDGIRYKSLASYGAGAGAGALSNVLGGFLGGKGGMLGKVGNFIGGASPLISAGAGALANQKGTPWKGAMQGFAGGGAGSAVAGGAGSAIRGLTQPGGTFGKAFSNFGDTASSSLMNYASEIPFMKGVGTDDPTGKLAQWLQGSGGGGTTASAPASIGTSNTFGPPAPRMSVSGGADGGGVLGNAIRGTSDTTGSTLQGSAKTGGMFDKLLQQLPGLALAGFGDMAAPKVEVPDIAGVGTRLTDELKSGTLGDSEARDLGMTELRRILGSELGQAPENAFALGDLENEESKRTALANYTNQFKSIRPGADFANDPEFLRGYNEIENKYDRVRTAQRDQTQFDYNRQQLTSKYNSMVQALNLDQNQMNQVIQLAQLEIDQLMLEYGLSVGEASEFKQLFGDLGQLMVQGTQPDQSFDMNKLMSMFQGGQ